MVCGDAMTRAPVLRVEGIEHGKRVMEWIDGHMDNIQAAVASTTSHGKLARIDKYPDGRSLFLRFAFETGDAMGMNMATIASEAVCRLIEKETGAVMISVSGNMCSDKKPAAINMINGRGKTVVAEARIPKDIVERRLHTTSAAVVETNYRKNLVGSSMAGTLGANAHAANMVAALYIATGQDPAQVVGGSMTVTSCEDVDGDLYICVRMPTVEVGTVGGGLARLLEVFDYILQSHPEAGAVPRPLRGGVDHKVKQILRGEGLPADQDLVAVSVGHKGHLRWCDRVQSVQVTIPGSGEDHRVSTAVQQQGPDDGGHPGLSGHPGVGRDVKTPGQPIVHSLVSVVRIGHKADSHRTDQVGNPPHRHPYLRVVRQPGISIQTGGAPVRAKDKPDRATAPCGLVPGGISGFLSLTH